MGYLGNPVTQDFTSTTPVQSISGSGALHILYQQV